MAKGTLLRFKLHDAPSDKRGRLPMARARYIKALGEALAELHGAGTLPTEAMVPGRTWAQCQSGPSEGPGRRGSPPAKGSEAQSSDTQSDTYRGK